MSSWPFCQKCSTVLDPPDFDEVVCSLCSFKCKFHDINVEEVLTKSSQTQKPSWISDEEEQEQMEKHAVIEEPCPKCGNPEMYFYTMQLRSVDEGSTVFYECPKCNHKYSQNN